MGKREAKLAMAGGGDHMGVTATGSDSISPIISNGGVFGPGHGCVVADAKDALWHYITSKGTRAGAGTDSCACGSSSNGFPQGRGATLRLP